MLKNGIRNVYAKFEPPGIKSKHFSRIFRIAPKILDVHQHFFRAYPSISKLRVRLPWVKTNKFVLCQMN